MIPHLSPRQREVCILIAAGCTTPEIGRRLQLSPRGVERYRMQLYEALGVRTLYEFMKRVYDEAGA